MKEVDNRVSVREGGDDKIMHGCKEDEDRQIQR